MRKYTIQDIDKMDGHEFEYFCAELLKNTGFENVNVTPGSGDQGIDVIAYKDGIKYGIQCKCYASDIGNKAVQEAFSGKEFYKCHIGVVLSNRYFTSSAMELAARNRILLWDRSYLIDLLKKADLLLEDKTEEDISYGVIPEESPSAEMEMNYKNNVDESVDETQSMETLSINDSIDAIRAENTEQNEKYDVFIVAYNKYVIKNSVMRDDTAKEISKITGISLTAARASLSGGHSRIMSNLSKEEAERIVESLKPMGCTVYMKENKGDDRKSVFSQITDGIAGVLGIILGIISPIMTKVSWDLDQRMGHRLGISTLMFAILSFLTTFPLIILIFMALSHNKPNDEQ